MKYLSKFIFSCLVLSLNLFATDGDRKIKKWNSWDSSAYKLQPPIYDDEVMFSNPAYPRNSTIETLSIPNGSCLNLSGRRIGIDHDNPNNITSTEIIVNCSPRELYKIILFKNANETDENFNDAMLRTINNTYPDLVADVGSSGIIKPFVISVQTSTRDIRQGAPLLVGITPLATKIESYHGDVFVRPLKPNIHLPISETYSFIKKYIGVSRVGVLSGRMTLAAGHANSSRSADSVFQREFAAFFYEEMKCLDKNITIDYPIKELYSDSQYDMLSNVADNDILLKSCLGVRNSPKIVDGGCSMSFRSILKLIFA